MLIQATLAKHLGFRIHWASGTGHFCNKHPTIAPGSVAAWEIAGACVKAAKDTVAATAVVATDVRSVDHSGAQISAIGDCLLCFSGPSSEFSRLASKVEAKGVTGLLLCAGFLGLLLTQADDESARRVRASAWTTIPVNFIVDIYRVDDDLVLLRTDLYKRLWP